MSLLQNSREILVQLSENSLYCANNQRIPLEKLLYVKEDTPHTLMPHENKYFASI